MVIRWYARESKIEFHLCFVREEFDKTCVKLFLNSTHHHLIIQTNSVKTYLSSRSNILQVGYCLYTVSVKPLIFQLAKYSYQSPVERLYILLQV